MNASSPAISATMPRYSDRVPIVTTMECTPSKLTIVPLTSPASVPVASPRKTSVVVFAPKSAATPIKTAARATIEATDTSISRAMISKAIGRAMRAFSEKLNVLSIRL